MTPEPPAYEIGPARFQQPEPPPADGVGKRRAFGAALLLIVLVVGVPVGLVLLDAVPGLPTSLPTREQLTGTIGVEEVLSFLVWIVWLAWLQFSLSVAVELRSALSGVGLPARVPLAGPSQRFARVLVASVLILITTVGPASAIAQAPTRAPDLGSDTVAAATYGERAMLPTVDGDVDPGGVAAGATAASSAAEATVTYQLGDMVLSAEDGAALVGQRVYVVQPPEGRYHDNLWDIAERTLGDGRRYQEIFDLNSDRVQPDGHELSLARLIYPNWLLVMPADAVGVDQVIAVQIPVPEPAPVSAPVGTAPTTASTGAATATAEAPAQATDVVDVVREQADANQQLIGAGLLAAGLLAAIERLRRRRRTSEPSESAVEVEVALRIGATPGRAAMLDGGLRHLAGLLAELGRDLPGVYAAQVSDTSVTLHLAPAALDAPAPWQASDDGSRWVLDSGVPTRTGHRRTAAPFPGLVSLGRDADDADVLVDLEAAQGPIAVVGDPAAALEVVTALAVELATNIWSDDLQVTGVDLPDELGALEPDRYHAADSIEDALPALRASRADALGAGVLSGRLSRTGASAWMPRYLVIGTTPTGSVVPQLLDLAATDARSPLGVVCVGELPGARWRLEVDGAGSLAVQLLDVEVTANRLTRAQVVAVAELLTPDTDADQVDERRAALEHEAILDRPAVTMPEHPFDRAGYLSAPVRVQVLGTPTVHADGPIEPDRLALATELVIYLALHPEGVHPTVLAGALWPRGVTAEVRTATIARTREWLGQDAAGSPHLREGADGRLRLGPGVVLDWNAVRTLLASARTATDPAKERRSLAAALRLVAGPILAERPTGRYAWLARVRLERASRDLLVDAAHRLAILCWHDNDPAGAREAAFSGLWVSATEELLWRDVLRATAAAEDPAALHRVAADMDLTLRAAGVSEMSAPTAALLDELLPGRAGPVADSAGRA